MSAALATLRELNAGQLTTKAGRSRQAPSMSGPYRSCRLDA